MMKCPKCGAELSDDTKFCSYCGTKMETIDPPPVDEKAEVSGTPQSESFSTYSAESEVPKSLSDKIKDKASEQWHKLSTYGKIVTIAICAFGLLFLVALLCYRYFANCVDRGCNTYEETDHQDASAVASYCCPCSRGDSLGAVYEPVQHRLW